jgi:hypothetical protein
MGQHIVQAPDGSQHIINAPDDATPDQITAMAPKLIPGYAPDPGSLPQSADDQSRALSLTRPAPSAPTPDAPGFFGKIGQMITGKQDPQYADTPSVFSQNQDLLQAPTGTAAMLGASDEQMADVMKKNLGDRFIGMSKDANGYPLIQYKDQTGNPTLGYVNKPGLDSEDVVRGVKGALPYAAAAEIAGPVLGAYGLMTRIPAAFGIGGSLSVGGDKALEPLGSEQGIEYGKAAVNAAAGPVAELAGAGGRALYQKFIAIPKYFDKSTGELTLEGLQAAQKMGLDPSTMASNVKAEFAKTYAMNPKDTSQMLQSVSDAEFGIPSTVGQRSKDSEQLMLEKNLRYGLQGLEAKTIMQSLDQTQNDAVENAVRSTIPSRLTGTKVNVPSNYTPGDYGQNIADSLKSAKTAAKAEENAAWPNQPLTVKTEASQVAGPMTPLTGVTKTATTAKALPLLNEELKTNLAPYANVINPENTPTAFKMWAYLNDFMQGKKPNSALHNALGLEGANDIDSVRKAVGLMSKDAETATDKMVSKAVYQSYLDWMSKAADHSLLSGDAAAVAQFHNARDISREMNQIFKPSEGGSLTPGGKLLESIQANADTPERVVSALFTGPQADIKAGAIEAIDKMKQGFQRYLPPDQAAKAWNDIRLAYWSKMTNVKTGDLAGYQLLKSNLKTMLNQQGTLAAKLYSPAEIAQIKRFIGQLDKITYKDPNPSGSASGIGAMMKQFVGKILDATPFARAAFEYTGIPERHAAGVAKKAVAQFANAPTRAPNAFTGTMGNALANPYAREQNN